MENIQLTRWYIWILKSFPVCYLMKIQVSTNTECCPWSPYLRGRCTSSYHLSLKKESMCTWKIWKVCDMMSKLQTCHACVLKYVSSNIIIFTYNYKQYNVYINIYIYVHIVVIYEGTWLQVVPDLCASRAVQKDQQSNTTITSTVERQGMVIGGEQIPTTQWQQ